MKDLEIKICRKCNKKLPLSAFHPNYNRSSGYRKDCKVCENERSRAYRQSKQDKSLCTLCTNIVLNGKKVCDACLSKNTQQTKERRRKQKIKAVEYKGSICYVCRKGFPAPVFDLHHSGQKDKQISDIISGPWSSIKSELDRCALVCLNCHRKLHYSKDSYSKRAIIRRNRKLKAIMLLGGSCHECGIHVSSPGGGSEIFDFHHIDSGKKEYSLAYLLSRADWNLIQQELSKCILVCANCHRIIHWKS